MGRPVGDQPVPLQGGEEYQVTGVGVPDVATVTGETYAVSLPGFDAPLTAHVGVTGVEDIQPRPVTRLDQAG